jgi:hypothetical protein
MKQQQQQRVIASFPNLYWRCPIIIEEAVAQVCEFSSYVVWDSHTIKVVIDTDDRDEFMAAKEEVRRYIFPQPTFHYWREGANDE